MGHDAKYQQWKREQARQEADKLSQMANHAKPISAPMIDETFTGGPSSGERKP